MPGKLRQVTYSLTKDHLQNEAFFFQEIRNKYTASFCK